jgi:hypothetical protein
MLSVFVFHSSHRQDARYVRRALPSLFFCNILCMYRRRVFGFNSVQAQDSFFEASPRAGGANANSVLKTLPTFQKNKRT